MQLELFTSIGDELVYWSEAGPITVTRKIRSLRAALITAHKYAGCLDAPGSAPECCSICKALWETK